MRRILLVLFLAVFAFAFRPAFAPGFLQLVLKEGVVEPLSAEMYAQLDSVSARVIQIWDVRVLSRGEAEAGAVDSTMLIVRGGTDDMVILVDTLLAGSDTLYLSPGDTRIFAFATIDLRYTFSGPPGSWRRGYLFEAHRPFVWFGKPAYQFDMGKLESFIANISAKDGVWSSVRKDGWKVAKKGSDIIYRVSGGQFLPLRLKREVK